MKPTIRISHKEGKAEQEYSLKAVEGFMVDSLRYTVYESKNFFGSPVTLAVEEKNVEGRPLQVTVKVAICSEEDSYNPELGRAIALGRAMRSKESGIILDKFKAFDEVYTEMAESYVELVATRLKDYLLERSTVLSINEINQQVGARHLATKFEEFK
jgi:hypothetical protein